MSRDPTISQYVIDRECENGAKFCLGELVKYGVNPHVAQELCSEHWENVAQSIKSHLMPGGWIAMIVSGQYFPDGGPSRRIVYRSGIDPAYAGAVAEQKKSVTLEANNSSRFTSKDRSRRKRLLLIA